MCLSRSAPQPAPPPPPPAPPPVLEQVAPEQAGGTTAQKRKREGLSRYRIETPGSGTDARTSGSTGLGGIPTRAGTGS